MAVEKTAEGAERVTFVRQDPTEHALLVCKLGAHHGNLKELDRFKPPGTDWATAKDLADAGFVDWKWKIAVQELACRIVADAKSMKSKDKATAEAAEAALEAILVATLGPEAATEVRRLAEAREAARWALAPKALEAVAEPPANGS